MGRSAIAILYTTSGDWAAILWQGHVFDTTGEWMGFLLGRDVFSSDGEYMGFVTNDQRIVRKRVLEDGASRPLAHVPSPPAGRPPIPSTVPLPPPMKELTFDLVDMLEEFPERFKQISNARRDMD